MKNVYDIALESMKGHPDAKLPKRSENGWIYLCPAHAAVDYAGFIADNKKNGEGPPILKCANGCSSKHIEKALRAKGLWFWDTKKDKNDENLARIFRAGWIYTSRDTERTPVLRVIHWDYFDTDKLVKTVVTRQRPDGKGGWENAPANYSVPPFNWQAVREKAFHGKTVFCVDGEENVELLTEWGLASFTHDGGSGNIWGFENSGIGTDCRNGTVDDQCVESVVIVPSNSKEGMAAARAKARFFYARQIPCKILALPGLAPINSNKNEGLIAWQKKGNKALDLCNLANDCPFWPPSDEELDEYIPAREPSKEEITPLPVAHARVPNDPFKYAFTEKGNAIWFERTFKETVAYLPKAKTWIIYRDGIWHFDDEKYVKSLMAQAIDIMQADMLASGRWAADKIIDWRNKCMNGRIINASLSLAEPEMKMKDATFNMTPWKLPCLNGVIDLKTGDLLPHSSEYKWTKCINLKYEPEHNFNHMPHTMAFLRSIFPNDCPREQLLDILAVLRCFAISLTGDPKFRKWFLLYGPKGREGKSTTAEAVLNVLGVEVFGITAKKYLITETLMDNKFTDPGQLKEHRFVLMDEIGSKDKIDNEKMKSITGNDSLPGSKLFENVFTFKPSHYLYVYGNGKPRFDSGGDTAAQERCIVIPFLRHFTEKEMDDTIKERVDSEATQLLSVLVSCCVEIWGSKSLGIRPFMTAAKEQWLKEEDLFGQFIEECITPSTTAISADELYDCFVWWCKSEQGLQKPWHKNVMGKEMVKRGFKTGSDTDNCRTYLNIAIRPACLVKQKKFRYKANDAAFAASAN